MGMYEFNNLVSPVDLLLGLANTLYFKRPI